MSLPALLPALRRLAMSSAPACARIHRMAGGSDEGICRVLSDANALCTAIAAAHRLTVDAVRAMAADLPAEPPTDPTPGMVEHIKFMNNHG